MSCAFGRSTQVYIIRTCFVIEIIIYVRSVSGYNTVMRRSAAATAAAAAAAAATAAAAAAGPIQQPAVMDNVVNSGGGLSQHLGLHHYYDCPKFC